METIKKDLLLILERSSAGTSENKFKFDVDVELQRELILKSKTYNMYLFLFSLIKELNLCTIKIIGLSAVNLTPMMQIQFKNDKDKNEFFFNFYPISISEFHLKDKNNSRIEICKIAEIQVLLDFIKIEKRKQILKPVG